MTFNKLALRQGEHMMLHIHRHTPPTYRSRWPKVLTIKVAMVQIFGIPVGDDWSDKCKPYTIVAIDKYPEGWGWIELDGDTKYEIGNYMLECGAEVGIWYYLTIHNGLKTEVISKSDDEEGYRFIETSYGRAFIYPKDISELEWDSQMRDVDEPKT